ncbi:MAG: class I tRNA ligase family protein [Desulfobacterales bacterium]
MTRTTSLLGLPRSIEHNVDKQLGPKKDMTTTDIRRECRAYAENSCGYSTRSEFKRLGGMGKWDEPYSTMAFHTKQLLPGNVWISVLDGSSSTAKTHLLVLQLNRAGGRE